MGTSASHEKLFNWRQIEQNRYVNKTTEELIDYQQVPITSNTEQTLTTYRNRLRIHKGHVVQLLYYCKVYGADGVCCEEKEMVDVYIEGGLERLNVARSTHSASRDSAKPVCYCVDILRGFESLKQLYGAFQVHSDMVWLDNKRRIKVWVNRNPFLNDYISVRENLMVLQIKQILLKQDCMCNAVIDQDLSLNTFKLKIQNIRENPQVRVESWGVLSGRHEHKDRSYNPNISFNTTTNNVVKANMTMKTNRNMVVNPTAKHQDIKRNIFYYPPNITLPLQNHTTRYHQHQSATPKYSRTEKLSATQKLYVNKEPEKRNKNEKRTHISFNTAYERQERKNNSTIISLNTKSSNSKVLFNYEDQSSKGTPNKLLTQPNMQSELSSPLQLSHLKYREKAPNATTQDSKNKPSKKPTSFLQPHLFWQEKKPEVERNYNLSLQYHRPSFQSQKSEDIKTPPFQLLSQEQKPVKKTSKHDKNLSFNLEEVRERENSELSREIQVIRKQIAYQNSYTDRQVNGSLKVENEKVRASVQSEKIQGNYSQIEYQMPEKTKLLIEKYLLNKEPSEKMKLPETVTQTRKMETKRGFLLNRQFFTRNRQKGFRISRESLQQNLNSQTIDERISQQAFITRLQENSSESQDFLQMKRATSAYSVSKMQKNQKEMLKKQMQKIFNFSPHDEEQTKIRKKVAQKKAFFADLKKEASKILDNKQQQF